MRLSPSMSIGAGIGFVLGILFTVIAAFRVDEEQATVGDAVQVGIFVGMPILVVMGTFAGWLWDIFIKEKR